MFPKFLLKKLYVKESLKKTDDGFSFIIKNNIANGEVVEVFSLIYNDISVPFENVIINSEGTIISSDSISPNTPVSLKKGVDTIFEIKDKESHQFEGQEIKITLNFKVRVRDSNMNINFDFKDTLVS